MSRLMRSPVLYLRWNSRAGSGFNKAGLPYRSTSSSRRLQVNGGVGRGHSALRVVNHRSILQSSALNSCGGPNRGKRSLGFSLKFGRGRVDT